MANDYCAELRYDVKNMYKTSGGSTVKMHRRNGSYEPQQETASTVSKCEVNDNDLIMTILVHLSPIFVFLLSFFLLTTAATATCLCMGSV